MLRDGFLRFCDDPEISCCKAEHELDELRSEVKRLREARRWVPVSERLPDVGGHVLVVYDDGFMLTSTVDEFDHGVTHWMPLPAPPNTEEKEA